MADTSDNERVGQLGAPPFTPRDFRELGEMPRCLLHGVSHEAGYGLLSLCEVRHLGRGQRFPEGGASEVMFIVLSGHVASVEQGESLRAGDSCGETFVLGDIGPPTVWAAVEPSRILVIGAAAFWCLARASHEFAFNLLLLLTQRVQASEDRLSAGERLRTQLEQQASTDALTGVRNRRWLSEMLPRIVHRHRFGKLPLSLMMADADHFKSVNDTHGHAVGDECLIMVANCAQTFLRPFDIASRYGGEEFAIVLPETPAVGAVVAAERLRKAVAEQSVELVKGGAVRLTISIGVAELREEEDARGLLERADRALYAAKRLGRNRVEVDGPG